MQYGFQTISNNQKYGKETLKTHETLQRANRVKYGTNRDF